MEKRIVELTREFFKQKGFWQMNMEARKEVCTAFWVTLCEEYELQAELRFDEENGLAYFRTGGGEIVNGVCTLYRPSLMTLLHEFRHILQHQIPTLRKASQDAEVDAQLWSHCIFCQAMPVLYTKNREKGIFHQAPAADQMERAWGVFTTEEVVEAIANPIAAEPTPPAPEVPIEQILQEALRR